MAERRMFSKTIIDSDAFLDMPLTTQALYFHLSMRADDDGFINNPMKVLRMIGCNKNDLDLLIAKRFLITFESGVVVIKHWRIHNYIQKDRYKETVYIEEKKMLESKENGAYKKLDTVCIQNGYCLEPQVRLGKDSIDKDKKDISSAFADDSDEIKICDYLISKILANNPKAKVPAGEDKQKWADHIDKLIRLDKRTRKEIVLVIDFCQADSFWKSNILSTKKLRDQFDKLWIQCNEKNGKLKSNTQIRPQPKPVNPEQIPDYFYEANGYKKE